ncbi:MAG: alpha/beta hydrolase [Gemmatimonadetes bacterium]|nr:alpha/beta hydrolase [Gemmatimonadota bacterium]
MKRVLLLLMATTACAGAQSRPAPHMIQYSELAALPAPAADERLAYGENALQFGELRLPPNFASARAHSVPVVVLIHGGCWRAAYDLRHNAPLAAAIAKEGYAVWTIEYRRLGDEGGGWPGTFSDAAAGVDYVRTLAASHAALDTGRVVIAGHSAGGQLALWIASRRTGEVGSPSLGAAPLAVKGVVSLAGITDMAAYGAAPGGCNSSVTPLMGGVRAEVAARYAAVSPIERGKLSVPVHMVHGVADPIVPIAQSESYAAATGAVVHRVEGAGHFDVVAPIGEAFVAVIGAIRAIVPVTETTKQQQP